MSNFLNFIKRRGDVYVDRGDPANYDFTVGDFTCDGNWHDLDLSSIVPSGATCVDLKIVVMDDAAGSYFAIRENGNTNSRNSLSTTTFVADIRNYVSGSIKCDENRIIEYMTTNTTFSNIDFLVRGWVMPGDVNDALKTDGTAGRVFRMSYFSLLDGTNANTLKCELSDRFNGDVIAQTDNITKNATTGAFTLSADGKTLHILHSALSGEVQALWTQITTKNMSQSITILVANTDSDIHIEIRNSTTGVSYDMTTLVDDGYLLFYIYYITNA